ncbi:MAG: hypothetical protein KJ945_03515, partial [Gammaproteobacteria bacterium]|nr:hypothetical protein [Gammaproteobacteria bacterium]
MAQADGAAWQVSLASASRCRQGGLHLPGVGFWPIEGNGLKMVRRNDKARSERALSERFERDSKR